MPGVYEKIFEVTETDESIYVCRKDGGCIGEVIINDAKCAALPNIFRRTNGNGRFILYIEVTDKYIMITIHQSYFERIKRFLRKKRMWK